MLVSVRTLDARLTSDDVVGTCHLFYGPIKSGISFSPDIENDSMGLLGTSEVVPKSATKCAGNRSMNAKFWWGIYRGTVAK